MSNFEELKQAEKGGSIQRFIVWQIVIFITCVIFIFISYDYNEQFVFIFLSNGLNGILFGLMQVKPIFNKKSQALKIMAYVKCEGVPPEDKENFNYEIFRIYNSRL